MKDWLKSKAPGTGGGGKFLSGWKGGKAGKGEITTWLHTACLPMTVWRHPFPMLIAVEDKNTGTKVLHVWGRNHTCHETEDVLEKTYHRETKGDPSSAREAPPERCGLCKTAEYLWQQCWLWLSLHRWVADKDEDSGKELVSGKWVLNKAGKAAKEKGKPLGLDPCAVLFKFISEADDDENTTIHVGGFCGLFGRDDLPKDLTKAMTAAKIRVKEAWKEKVMVKPMSVMCVVDNDKPEKGVQISEETKELGEKVKEKITEVWEGSEVDIQRRPYAIRWSYDRSKTMGKQYTATPMMKLKPDARILSAIRSDAPDLSSVETPFNQQQFRALFERHAKIKEIPWDELFPSKEQEKKWAEEDAEAEAAATEERPAKTKKRRSAEDEEPDADDEDDDSEEEDDGDDDDSDEEEDIEEDDDGEELVACDKCKKPHKLSATKCPHCGHVYEVEEDEEEEEEEEPAQPRSRSEAKKTAAKKTAAKKASASKKKDEEDEEEEEEEEDDDEEDDDADDDDGDGDEDSDDEDDNQGDGIPF